MTETRRRWFWSLLPASVRDATDAVVSNFLLHWFPARVRVASMSWTPSFWLGTVSGVLFVLLLLTGLPLMAFYVPSTRDAYASVKDIEHVVSYGWWLRAAHRMAAHLMVVAVTLHACRVFLTGSFRSAGGGRQHREWNWVIGVALLVCTILLSFTGYLLPWDQLAFWAVTVSMNIVGAVPAVGASLREWLLGGRDVGQPALLRFYLLHIVALPAATAVLFAYHMWRLRKDGGMAHPQDPDEDTRVMPAIPTVIGRVAVVTFATWAAVTVLAIIVPSPLEEPANPLVTPNPAKAPWYFLWLQEIVADTTIRVGDLTLNGALIGGALLPLALFVLVTAWPWLDRTPVGMAGALWPRARRVQVVVAMAIVVLIAGLTMAGLMRGPSWQWYWPWQTWPPSPSRF